MGAPSPVALDKDGRVQYMLQAIGGANAALLLLPLLLLATLPLPHSMLGSSCHGWVTQRLARCCAAAVLCHWLGLVVTFGQLAFLSAAADAKVTFDWCFAWHSVAPVLLTVIGSILGIMSLWGHLAIVHGDCSPFPLTAIAIAVLAAMSMALLYMTLFRQALRSTRCTAGRRPDEGYADGAFGSFSLAIDTSDASAWVMDTSLRQGLDDSADNSVSGRRCGDDGKVHACDLSGPSRPAISQAAAAVAVATDAERESSATAAAWIWQSPGDLASAAGAGQRRIADADTLDAREDNGQTSEASAAATAHAVAAVEASAEPSGEPSASKPGRSGSKDGSGRGRQVSISITAPDGTNTQVEPPPPPVAREQFTRRRQKLMRLSLPEVNSPRRRSAGGWASGSTGADGSAGGAGLAADQPAITQWRGKFLKRGSAPTLCRVGSAASFLGGSAAGGRQPPCPLNTLRPSSPSGFSSPVDLDTRFADAFEMRQRALSVSASRASIPSLEDETESPASAEGAERQTPLVAAWTTDGVAPKADSARGRAQAAAGREVLAPAGVLHEAVHIFQTDPINYDKVFENTQRGSHKEDKVDYEEVQGEEDENIPDESRESLEGEEEEGDDEVWNCGQVEVPIWLLDRMKADGWQPPEDATTGVINMETGDESSGTGQIWHTDTSKDWQHGNEDSLKRQERHVSFSDQPLERQKSSRSSPPILSSVAEQVEDFSDSSSDSSSRKNSRSPRGDSRSPLGGVKVGDTVPAKTFWKIPLPTRKNSMLGLPQELEMSRGNSVDAGGQASTIPRPLGAPPALSMLQPPPSATGVKRLSAAGLGNGPAPERATRRRSSLANTLSLITDEAAKTPGLYAVPKEEDGTGEIIEIRRRSLVMSTSMLSNIIQSKVGQDRENERLPSTAEDDGEEVVLPLFRPEQGKYVPRQCQCKVDPVTGYVIHTCMTPATTAAENTQGVQSYICSEWNSRRASRRNSRPESGTRSRRSSQGFLMPEEDEQGFTGKQPMKKRIRNASMLEQIGKKGPKPARKGTDEPEAVGSDQLGKEDDEEITAENENELAVSFANIHGGCTTSPASRRASESDVSGSTSADTVTPAERRSVAAEGAGTNGTDLSAQGMPGAVFVEPGRQLEDTIGQRFDLIEPYRLAEMLQDSCREQLLIVDVRGRDWAGGHIPFSINLRTTEVMMNPGSVLFQCRRSRINHVVFTCMYSVLRARKCVVAVDAQQEEEQKAGIVAYPIRISLLAGGFHAWMNYFAREASEDGESSRVSRKYVDSFDPHMWSDGGPSQGGLVHVMDALWSSGGQKALSDALTQELQTLATRTSPAVSQGNSANTSRRGSEQSVSASRRCSEQSVGRLSSSTLVADPQ